VDRPALASPDLVIGAQPPTQPHRCVVVECPIRFVDVPYTEVVRKVGVNDIRLATKQPFLHLVHRLLGVTARTVGILFRCKISLKDQLKHPHRCCHADPIPHGRNAQQPELAVGLRDVHSSDRIRSESLLPVRKRQFAKPPLNAIRFDIREVLTIDPRCALVGTALSIGMRQGCPRGRSCRIARKSDTLLLPSLSRITPSAVSEHSSELIGCPISWSLAICRVCLKLRFLPSPGVTQLQRHYRPPPPQGTRPVPRGCPVGHPRPRREASRVAYAFLVYMLPPLSRCTGWAHFLLISPIRISLPRKGHRIGLHITLFEAARR
jgi:hypothetical protein